MNQILETKNTNGAKFKTRRTKTIKIFAIAIILFAIIITAIAGFALYNKYILEPKNKQEKPSIKLEQLDELNIKIFIQYDDELSKVSYQWDDGDITETITSGKEVQKLVQIPSENGIHTLTIKVYAADGTENKVVKTYELQEIVEKEPEPEPQYTQAPEISRTVDTVNKLVNFVVTDDRGIDYLVYYWEGEAETMIQADPNNNTKLEASIEVNRGENLLTIKAVDIDGNETVKSAKFKGLKVPEISAIKFDDTVKVTITHDMGFEKIEFVINGEAYIYDELCEGYDSTKTTLEYTFDLQEGENTVIINAYSTEGTTKNYSGRCTN